MVEVEGLEVEVLREEQASPNIEVGVDLPTGKGKDPTLSMIIETEKENTGSGTRASQQVPAPEENPEAMKRSPGRGTKSRWRWSQKDNTGPTLDTSPRSMRKRRELEALV